MEAEILEKEQGMSRWLGGYAINLSAVGFLTMLLH